MLAPFSQAKSHSRFCSQQRWASSLEICCRELPAPSLQSSRICMLRGPEKGLKQVPHITWSVAEHAWRQSRAALHSGSFTHANIWGPQFLIMRAMVNGPDALKLSKRSTCEGSAGSPSVTTFPDK